MNDKIKKMILLVGGILIIFILILFMTSSCKKRLKPEGLENLMTKNTQSYYERHESELPSLNSTMTLSLNDLVTKGIIDELEKLLEKDTNCSGSIIIENNNNNYMYSPVLNCTSSSKNYSTNNLKEVLQNTVVTFGNGLYNTGSEYIFRGDNLNNYLMFDGILWRIMKINSDGTIRIIEEGKRKSVPWDNRYNSNKLTNTGFNNFINNGLNSRMKDYLDDIYKTENVLSNNAKGYIKPATLCVGKRGSEEVNNSGMIECSQTIENQYLGLIQVNEFLNASLDPNCQKTTAYECTNFNYLSESKIPYWTITGTTENDHQVYKISGRVTLSNASSNGMAKLVINISENTNVSGTGTKDDPYVVSGFKNELKDFSKITTKK